MEQSSPNTTSTSMPLLAKMRPWDKDTLESIELRRPFLAYTESDTSYSRHEVFIQGDYHIGKRLSEQVAIIGGQFSYYHKVHCWIYLDELVEMLPLTGKWYKVEEPNETT